MKITTMGFKIVLLFIVATQLHFSLAALRVDCIDNVADFEKLQWIAQSNTLQAAESSADLPVPLQGHSGLEGINGIMYFRGGGAYHLRRTGKLPKWPVPPGNLQYLWKNGFKGEVNSTFLMYVKYYAHIEKPVETTYAIAFPSLKEEDQNLPSTTDFQWREVTVELSPVNVNDGDEVGLTAKSFEESDYFVVDRIVLAEFEAGSDIENLPGLCFGEPISTDTTTQSTTTTTSTKAPPSEGFECQKGGFRAQPGDCSKFHVCLYDTFGLWGDLLFTCPAPQVWCPETEQCESASICPCAV